MTDPQPTAATDDVVDLVRIQCDASFGNLVGELTSQRDAAAFVAALEQRGVLLLLDGDAPPEPTAAPVPATAHDVVIHVSVAADHVTLPKVLDALTTARITAGPQA